MPTDHQKQKEYSSIKRYVLSSMILVPLIPFVVTLVIGFYHFKSFIEKSTLADMQRIVEGHRQLIEAFLEERRSDLEFISTSFAFETLRQPENLRDVFVHLQKESKAFIDIGVFDKDGNHRAYHGPYNLAGKVYKDADWFKEVRAKGYYISDVFTGYRKVPHFVIAVAREGDHGPWVIRATIDSRMFRILVGKVRIGETGEAYIINRQGVLQTERRSGGQLMETVKHTFDDLPLRKQTRSLFQLDESGTEYLYTVTDFTDKKWRLVVRQVKEDAFKALHATVLITVVIWISGGLLIVLAAFYLTERIVGRIQKIDTEKEQLNQQLVGASRLAELGEMAAGFAHEINNPLQIIKNEQTLIGMELEELEKCRAGAAGESFREIQDSMSQINLQISRCAKITQAILKFGRQGEPEFQDIELNGFIQETTEMISKKARVSGIQLRQNFTADQTVIYGDPTQLQQVLLNFYNNAIDAITAQHGIAGGILNVETLTGENGHVDVRVRDNGCGIRPENLNKIFSPFFTTKPVGHGTGLGLSVCYGIINKMNGTVTVTSDPARGTTFSIRLPISVQSDTTSSGV